MISNECLSQYLNCADRAALSMQIASFDLKHVFLSSMMTAPMPVCYTDSQLAQELQLLAKLVSTIKIVGAETSQTDLWKQ